MQPPAHRVDAQPVLILPSDPAWDMERIDKERKALRDKRKKTKAPIPGHPVDRYLSGEGRYDLGAKYPIEGEERSALEYLKSDVSPTRFVLRRLNWREFYRVQDAAAISQNHCALLACQIGLEAVEAGDGIQPIELERDASGRISDDCMEILFQLGASLGGDVPVVVGMSCYAASVPLRAPEKKA